MGENLLYYNIISNDEFNEVSQHFPKILNYIVIKLKTDILIFWIFYQNISFVQTAFTFKKNYYSMSSFFKSRVCLQFMRFLKEKTDKYSDIYSYQNIRISVFFYIIIYPWEKPQNDR